MAQLVGWDVTLTIRGPVLTTSSAPLEFGIDAPFARNAAGEYYLAGTLVKGRLKEAWRELENAGFGQWDWKTWSGPEPKEEQDWTSSRGLLQFTDFIYSGEDVTQTADEVKITYRIAHDDATGTVFHGQNQMIRTPFQAAGDYPFKGRIWAITSAETAKVLDRCLIQGFCWVPGVGADTNVGFGVISNIAIERISEYAHGSGWTQARNAESWSVALTPEGFLCIGGKRVAENIFESETEIPGGVLKGAIADAIVRLHDSTAKDVSFLAKIDTCTMKELCQEFSKIRVLHAKAVKRGDLKRPNEIPASAVQVGTPSALKDTALTQSLSEHSAPAFRIDWKSSKEAEFGVTHVPHELRVRTQINSTMRRAADKQLFAYRMAVPRAHGDQGGIDEFEWLTGFSFAQIRDAQTRQTVSKQLANLLAEIGIPGVGKLKTRCVASFVSLTPSSSSTTKDKIREMNSWVVMLQTPALLCDVSAVAPGLSDATTAYKAYWEEASGQTLTLERHFARQTLMGGDFLWNRFSRQSLYSPYVLTNAGAVFVLRVMNGGDAGAAAMKVEEWVRNGLPLATTVRKRFGLAGNAGDWKKCPYVPENGYGEIAVDQEWHWKEVCR